MYRPPFSDCELQTKYTKQLDTIYIIKTTNTEPCTRYLHIMEIHITSALFKGCLHPACRAYPFP